MRLNGAVFIGSPPCLESATIILTDIVFTTQLAIHFLHNPAGEIQLRDQSLLVGIKRAYYKIDPVNQVDYDKMREPRRASSRFCVFWGVPA